MNRTGKYTINAVLALVFALGAAVLIQAISSKNASRFDLTSTKAFTLSDQTDKVLATVEDKLTLICFYKDTQEEIEKLKDLLRQYTHANPKITYEIKDPDRNKALSVKYGITSAGTIIARYREHTQTIDTLSEQSVTNAIMKLVQGRTKKIYMLSGHGEKAPARTDEGGLSNITGAMEAENFSHEELLLMRKPAVPEDCDLLLVSGPEKDLMDEELAAIKNYIAKGGKAVFMIDPQTAPKTCAFIKDNYGIVLGNDIIVDPVSRVFGGDYLIPVITAYEPHPITRDFDVASFFPLARTVDTVKNFPAGVAAAVFAKTSKGSWGETDFKMLDEGQVEFTEKSDTPGPLGLAAAAIVTDSAQTHVTPKEDAKETGTGDKEAEQTKPTADKPAEGRIVVFGDSDFINNSYFSVSGNRDVFINSVRWLCEEENLISIRPKERKNEPLILTPAQIRNVFMFSIILIPMMVVFTGILVYRTRRFRNETK